MMANDTKPGAPVSVFGHGGKDLGSSGHGVGHWWTQRVLTIIGMPMVLVMVLVVAWASGRGPGQMLLVFSYPPVTILLGLSMALMIMHMRLGLQQVIEDYVTARCWRYAAFIFNDAFCAVVAMMTLYALIKFSAISVLAQFV